MGTDSATALATQQSIKAYVDAKVTAEDLDFQGDSGGALSIDLETIECVITSPSSSPILSIILAILSEPKSLISLSSRLK